MATSRTNRTSLRARAEFLEELRKRGNVRDACRTAGIGRQTVYDLRGRDPEFAAAWDEAVDEAVDTMEGEAWRRAVEGVDEPVFGRVARDQDGEVGTIRKYSDALMNTLLKAHRPEKYRERVDVQQHGKVEIEFVNNWREAD